MKPQARCPERGNTRGGGKTGGVLWVTEGGKKSKQDKGKKRGKGNPLMEGKSLVGYFKKEKPGR